ncbi:MAG: hypothetical protein JXA73_24295 [Acidobacteria bacterium]|nr:hypothetical protein [Acidobacteriota bacterium]
MTRIGLIGVAITVSFQLASAQDFHKKYKLPPRGLIIVENAVGDIKIKGHKGDEIEAHASKTGADRDSVEIIDTSMGNRIEIHIRPTQFRRVDAKVELIIRVPNSIEYNFERLSSFGGNVEVTDVVGRLRAESIRGNVELSGVKGLMIASSFSGNVRMEIEKSQDRNNMRFTSVSGNIDILAPSDLDALVDMSSSSGVLKTDFPLQIQESRYGPGRSARGRLGTGKQILRVSSVTGRVSLNQK